MKQLKAMMMIRSCAFKRSTSQNKMLRFCVTCRQPTAAGDRKSCFPCVCAHSSTGAG